MKHDAHVLKYKIHTFPFKTFIFALLPFFALGVLIGQFFGFNSCYNFTSIFR